MSRIPMFIIKVWWPKIIDSFILWSCTSHVIMSLLFWVSYMIRHTNDLIRVTTLIRWMWTSTITTTLTLVLRPTLTYDMIPPREMMEILPFDILISLSSRRSSSIVPLILILTLTSLVLLRMIIVHYLITVLSIPTKLACMTRLLTLNTLKFQPMLTRLNLRRGTMLLTPNQQGHLIRETLKLHHHCLLES